MASTLTVIPKLISFVNLTDVANKLFELTAFELNKLFVLSKKDGYHVRYTFTPIDENITELEYYEWMVSLNSIAQRFKVPR